MITQINLVESGSGKKEIKLTNPEKCVLTAIALVGGEIFPENLPLFFTPLQQKRFTLGKYLDFFVSNDDSTSKIVLTKKGWEAVFDFCGNDSCIHTVLRETHRTQMSPLSQEWKKAKCA